MIERYESYRGRTTPEIEWRVWNEDHTCFMAFKTKREAVAYEEIPDDPGHDQKICGYCGKRKRGYRALDENYFCSDCERRGVEPGE